MMTNALQYQRSIRYIAVLFYFCFGVVRTGGKRMTSLHKEYFVIRFSARLAINCLNFVINMTSKCNNKSILKFPQISILPERYTLWTRFINV